MGKRSYSSAKNFGIVGAMFAGTECCIEGVGLSPFSLVISVLVPVYLPCSFVSTFVLAMAFM